MKTMLFNPYTGRPRHPSDIASDPAGKLMLDPDEPLRPVPKGCAFCNHPDTRASCSAMGLTGDHCSNRMVYGSRV